MALYELSCMVVPLIRRGHIASFTAEQLNAQQHVAGRNKWLCGYRPMAYNLGLGSL